MRLFLIIIGLAFFVNGAVSFVRTPSITRSGDNWVIDFELSSATDVEVSIVNVKDSSVVRHLAAGVLGANAPVPFQKNTLHQTLTWNGCDNFGIKAETPDSLKVRVRAGMSVDLAQKAGEDLYQFVGAARSSPSIVLQSDGSVILFGKAAHNSYLRKYDAAGNYVKTLYPPPAGLPSDSVVSYGINVLPGGGWAPRVTAPKPPTIASSYLNDPNTIVMPGGLTSLILVNGNNQQTISTEGCFTTGTSKPLIVSPAAPAGWAGPWGPQYLTPTHNPEYLYLSGRYYGNTDGGSWLTVACDTGFWADGQIFRVNKTTGIVQPWLKLDSVPILATERAIKIGGGSNGYDVIHGVTTDDSGLVYVCDRLHRRIGIYDTNAVLQGSIPCIDPDIVALSKRTGAIYVVVRTRNVNLSLRKFSSWKSGGTSVGTAVLTTSTGDGWKGASAIALSENNGITYIWIGYGTIGFRLYRDNGTDFTLLRDFSTGTGQLVYDRIAVDRKTDKLYFEKFRSGTTSDGIYSISNWTNPVAKAAYTLPQKRLLVNDITVGPKGQLYGYQYPGGNNYYDFPVCRFSGDSLHIPVNYSNTGKNRSTSNIHFEGTNNRGLAVGWQGQVAVSCVANQSDGHDNNSIYVFPDTGYEYPDSVFMGNALVRSTTSKSSGIRFDVAGNLYIGTGVKPTDWITPSGFENDNYFKSYSGSIVKYAAGETGAISGTSAIGAAKVFPHPFGTYGGHNATGWCTCWNPRFDADPYGRLYIPNSAAQKVSVADNEGNTILTFGEYGNTDYQGEDIPLIFPYSTAASEDYIYVGDLINARILRIKMNYEIDNIPGLTDRPSGAVKDPHHIKENVTLFSSPNPFNPSSSVTVSLPSSGFTTLSVFSLDGRLVKTIVSKHLAHGKHNFTWNSRDNRGGSVPAGIYAYRLMVNNSVIVRKTILAK